MPRVRVRNGPNKGLVYQIGGDAITIGRDTTSVIQILDRGASRHHAEIFRVGEMCFIRDLGSRNGTYVNDKRITEDLMREGDRVQIGSTVIIFESEVHMKGDTRQIDFSRDDDEGEVSGTLELRLDDLVGFDSDDDIDRDSVNLTAIIQISKIVAGGRDEKAMLDKVCEYIADLAPADNIYIFLLQRDGDSQTLMPRSHYEKEPDHGRKFSKGIMRRAIQERRSILSSDAMHDARFKARDSIIINLIRSVICVPFICQDAVLGVLYMTCNRAGEAFVNEDLELVSTVATQVALALDNMAARRHQRETFLSAIRALIATTEMRDPDTRGHSERVASYAAAIARQMGLSEREWTNVQLAALLHDIGKLALAGEIKTEDEFHLQPEGESGEQAPGQPLGAGKTLREHPALGAEIAKSIVGAASELAPAIRHHHELHDGSGYPDGLAGDRIPLLARIIAVADRLDHLTTLVGENNEGLSMKAALITLDEQADQEFDLAVVRALHIAHRGGTLLSPQTVFGEDGGMSVPPATPAGAAADVPEKGEDSG